MQKLPRKCSLRRKSCLWCWHCRMCRWSLCARKKKGPKTWTRTASRSWRHRSMRSFFVLGSGLTPRERSPFVLLDGDMDADATVDIGLRGPSPPKQARLDGTYSPSIMLMSPSSGGHHKPSEEELDEEGGRGNWEHKRSRTESHPRSISAVWSSWHEILLPRCHFARGVQAPSENAQLSERFL
ncbi:hypothetical protein C8Q72DRAFT_866246 [Fomitopsis betulina]|nr:hypothetical protein C8Q72DRAFT_866246 [Fomitopsis betulina]